MKGSERFRHYDITAFTYIHPCLYVYTSPPLRIYISAFTYICPVPHVLSYKPLRPFMEDVTSYRGGPYDLSRKTSRLPAKVLTSSGGHPTSSGGHPYDFAPKPLHVTAFPFHPFKNISVYHCKKLTQKHSEHSETLRFLWSFCHLKITFSSFHSECFGVFGVFLRQLFAECHPCPRSSIQIAIGPINQTNYSSSPHKL